MKRIYLAAACLLIAASPPARASVVFSTAPTATVSSQSVEAKATFGEIGSTGNWDGTIVLQNKAVVPTKAQLLTGILFSVDNGNPILTLTSAGLNYGSVVVLDSSGTTSSAAIDLIGDTGSKKGRYQFKSNPGGTIGSGGFAQEYGVGTIGGGVFQGNVVGNDDYAIMGAGTDITLSTFGGQFPYIRDSILLTFGGLGAGVSLNHITGVTFVYGSLPDGFVPGRVSSVPEPGTLAAGLLGAFAGVRALRRRKSR